MKEKSRTLVNSGEVMYGKYMIWLTRNKKELDLDNGDFIFLSLVAEQTLSWKMEFAYIPLVKFEENNISKKILQMKRTPLVEKNLIKWRKTNGFTEYQIVLPSEITDEYEFLYGT
jgi:hypothetical protein